MKKIFTTLNTMQEDTSINMKLIQGPFKRLDGRWEFEDSGDGGSTVSLVMEFESVSYTHLTLPTNREV